MLAELSLSDALRALRLERGLTLSETAYRAGLSVNSLQSWETGRQVPKGRTLARALDVLDAPTRTRTRLIGQADPRFARRALVKAPLGPPLNLGMVLRAMRGRRGVTQAELARTVGVTQGTVARWESGDVTPPPQTLHEVGFALGATVEETVALASAQGGAPNGLPDAPEIVQTSDDGLSLGLQEVMLLGYEAELWRRAARDERWELSLCSVIAKRTNLYALDGRFGEIPALAERVIRLASTAERKAATAPAVNALTEVAAHRGQSPAASAQICGSWAEGLTDPMFKAWMIGSQAYNLARAGARSQAVDRMKEACDLDESDERYGEFEPRVAAVTRGLTMTRLYLEAGMAEAAAETIAPFRCSDAEQDLYVRVEHANGRSVDEASMEYLRYSLLRVPQNVNWKNLDRLERIERRQAVLDGVPPRLVQTSDLGPDDADARSLWAAVPGGRPWGT